MGQPDDPHQPGIAGGIGREHPRGFKLEHEPGQGMGEHIVHLPGQPLALGHPNRLCLRGPGALQLDQKPFGLVAGLPQPSCQERHPAEADNRDGAEERRGGRAAAAGRRDHRRAHDTHVRAGTLRFCLVLGQRPGLRRLDFGATGWNGPRCLRNAGRPRALAVRLRYCRPLPAAHRAVGLLGARYAQAPPFDQLTAGLLTCSSGGACLRPRRPRGRP
jgi:hypothetical protein